MRNIKYSLVLIFITFFFSNQLISQSKKPLQEIISFEKVYEISNLEGFRISRRFDYAFSFPNLYTLNRAKKIILITNIKSEITSHIDIKEKGWYYVASNGNVLVVTIQKSQKSFIHHFYKIVNSKPFFVKTLVSDEFQYVYPNVDVDKSGYCNYFNLQPRTEIQFGSKSLKFEFDHPVLTLSQPNQFIDFTDLKFLTSKSSDYSIKFYNNDLKLISEINYDNRVFKGPDVSKLAKIEEEFNPRNPQAIFSRLNSLQTTSDLIWSVEFINDTSIFVTRTDCFGSKSGKLSFKYDIWSYKNGVWELEYFNIYSDNPEHNQVIGSTCLPFTLFEYGTQIFIENGKMYILKQDIPGTVFGKSVETYLKEKEDWYNQNNGIYKVYVYKILE